MRIRRKWTRQLVIDLVLERYRKGLPLNGGAVSRDDRTHYDKAREFFGEHGWQKALKAAGFDPRLAVSGITRKWTPEFFDATLRTLHKQHIPLNEQFLRKNGLRDVHEAGIKIHSSWKAAVESIGLDYDTVRQRRPKGWWSWERVIAEIKRLKQQGEPLNLTYVQYVHGDLYAASYVHGTGWPDAVQAAGFNYIEESKQFPTQWWLRSLQHGDLERIRGNVIRFAEERITHEQEQRQETERRKREGAR